MCLMIKRPRLLALIGILAVVIGLLAYFPDYFPGGRWLILELQGKATVSARLAQYGPASRKRWQTVFQRTPVIFPPQRVVLLGLKQERRIEVYAANSGQPLSFIRSFPVIALSGRLGPKLREGDMQSPEGFYRVESLNPNSSFHLALRVNYPNAEDRRQARRDGRLQLGSDIMIHGSGGSVGCWSMQDEAAEDLFVLAADTGLDNIHLVLSPVDFRIHTLPQFHRPSWTNKLYGRLKAAVRNLPLPEATPPPEVIRHA